MAKRVIGAVKAFRESRASSVSKESLGCLDSMAILATMGP